MDFMGNSRLSIGFRFRHIGLPIFSIFAAKEEIPLKYKPKRAAGGWRLCIKYSAGRGFGRVKRRPVRLIRVSGRLPYSCLPVLC